VKRPPDKKIVLAALVLLLAASTLMSKPEAGFAHKAEMPIPGDFPMLVLKQSSTP
jgi:hypothetical protein